MSPGHRLVAQHVARKHGLPLDIVCAIVAVESSGDPWAYRVEPAYPYLVNCRTRQNYRTGVAGLRRAPEDFPGPRGITADSEWIGQQTSWGLMQVMGAVAREHGFADPFPALCEPLQGLEYGCRHLARLRDRHLEAHGWMGVLDAYNDGTARIERPFDYPHKVAAAGAEWILS